MEDEFAACVQGFERTLPTLRATNADGKGHSAFCRLWVVVWWSTPIEIVVASPGSCECARSAHVNSRRGSNWRRSLQNLASGRAF